MKKIILLTTVLLVNSITSFSQNSKIDSLQAVLKTAKEDTNKVYALNDLAIELEDNNPDTAIVLGKEALQLAEKLKWQMGVMVSYKCLGDFSQSKGDYSLEITYYSQCIAICGELEKAGMITKSRGLNIKSRTMNNIGLVYQVQGDYPKALDYGLKSLKMAEELGNKKGISTKLGNIGIVYEREGDYSKAIDYYLRSLKMAEELGDKFLISRNIINIAINYCNEGDYPKALEYDFKALEMGEELKDKNVIEHAFGNIGLTYFNQAKSEQSFDKAGSDSLYSNALDYYFKALKMGEELGEKDDIATDLGNIGGIYEEQAEHRQSSDKAASDSLFSKALDYYLKALKMGEEIGDKQLQTINLCNIGSLYTKQNKLKEADQFLQDALKLATGIGALNLINESNEDLSELYSKKGDGEKALSYSYQSFQTSRSFLLNNLSSLSESEKSDFVKTVADNSNSFFSHAYFFKSASDSSLKWLYDYQLLQRGIVLESSSGLAAAVQQDTSLQGLWVKFSGYKSIVGKEYLKPIDERRKDLAVLEDSANNLEKDLLSKSITYSNWKERVNATWQDVQKHLVKDEAAVEFVSFHLLGNEKRDSVLYAAIVLTPQMKYPKLVFLFEEKQLADQLKNTAMRGIKIIDNSASGSLENGDSLYKLILKPLMPYLKNINSISFAPDGLLHKINLAAISGPNGKPLCETYKLRQMASTRSIVFPPTQPAQQPAAFFGGIDFTYTIPKEPSLNADSSAASRSDGKAFDYLKGTKDEVDALSNLYKNKKYSYQRIEGKDATEKTFKQMEGKSPAVLHIATHGFFFPSPDKNERHITGGESTYSLAEDPLLRSGLILAGGNYAWANGTNPYEEEDGILTAYEISHLNLSTTDVVVLSACETGLGDIKGAEGVYGLQRAFKMAGVKYIIMSLWQIPDKETQEFMQIFYSKWLNGEKIRSAFQKTQREMAAKYEPYKWAAFVLVE